MFGKFQGWTRFLRKMVLYLLAKFDIFHPCLYQQYSVTQKIRFRLFADFKANL